MVPVLVWDRPEFLAVNRASTALSRSYLARLLGVRTGTLPAEWEPTTTTVLGG